VRTGYGADVENEAPPGVEPAAIVDTLANAAELIVTGTPTSARSR
jgi:hypothetical protein